MVYLAIYLIVGVLVQTKIWEVRRILQDEFTFRGYASLALLMIFTTLLWPFFAFVLWKEKHGA